MSLWSLFRRKPRCTALWQRDNVISKEFWPCADQDGQDGHEGDHSWRKPR